MTGRSFSRDLGMATLCAFFAIACGHDGAVAPPPPPPAPALVPANLSMVSGDGQSAVASNRLTDPLVVRLTTVDGIPVPFMRIQWSVTTDPGGELSTTVSLTDSKGEAFVNWVLGTTPGWEGARAVYTPIG